MTKTGVTVQSTPGRLNGDSFLATIIQFKETVSFASIKCENNDKYFYILEIFDEFFL